MSPPPARRRPPGDAAGRARRSPPVDARAARPATPDASGDGAAGGDDLSGDGGAAEDAGAGAPPASPSFGLSLRRFALFAAGAAAIGLFAGIAFGRTAPRQAAGALVADAVIDEPVEPDAAAAPAGAAAPTSGASRGPARCGVAAVAVPPAAQVASLAAGIVVIQYDPARVDVEDVAVLEGFAADRRADVLVAPNGDLAPPVVATAWGRRLPLEEPREDLLGAFVTAYGDEGPGRRGCAG